jgi:hypothetical protein
MPSIRYLLVVIAVALSACTTIPSDKDTEQTSSSHADQQLFSAEQAIQDEWQHLVLAGKTHYKLAVFDGQVAISAEGRQSASALIRPVSLNTINCPVVEWSWYVKDLQEDADIRRRDSEDVAASLYLMFGDPGFLFNPKPVPTLRYVWSNAKVANESIVDSPYLPGTVRSLVLRNNLTDHEKWVMEKRNVVADFKNAFGRLPDSEVQAIALFTDNDQTRQPVLAYYGSARAVCNLTD